MENRKLVIFLAVVFLAIPLVTYSYQPENTHKGLTRDIVRFYERSYSKTFTVEDKIAIEKGAVEEDSGARALNHFYDPVYNKAVLPSNLTSKEWAVNTLAQANANTKYRVTLGNLANAYFASDDDYSWDRAVYEYAHGDKKRGLEGLGHILHLIEDATVPDHTRDDPHPDFVWRDRFNQESPYEKFADKFNTDNIKISDELIKEGAKPVLRSSLGEYFDALADYSNNNFFSKDTIFDKKYQNPTIVSEKYEKLSDGLEYKFGYNKGHLVWIIEIPNLSEGKMDRNYSIMDTDRLILTDYWNLLSRQAVENGAGVIKLFFDDVEKEKQTLALLDKNKSWISKQVSNLASAFASLVGRGNKNLTDKKTNNLASAFLAVNSGESNQEKSTQQAEDKPAQQAEDKPAVKIVQTTKPSTNSGQASSPQKSPEPIVQPAPAIAVTPPPSPPADNVLMPKLDSGFNMSPGFGGGGGGGSSPPAEEPPAPTCGDSLATNFGGSLPCVYPPSAPTIIFPSNFSLPFATTTVTFTGTSSPQFIISNSLTSATTTADGSGDWTMSFSSLSQGTTTVNFIATNLANATSSPRIISFAVDTISPNISVSIPACGFSLRAASCLIPTSQTVLKLTSTATDISYFEIFRDNVSVGTTTNTTATVSTSDGAHTLFAVAVDIAGNRATSTTATAEISSSPIVINEVAWAGSAAASSDEWGELYNKTSETLQLSSVTLAAGNGTPYIPLSGTIAAGGYYLIERGTDGNAVSDVAGDLNVPFSGLLAGSGLEDAGEVLSLIHGGTGIASTTVDSTPAVSSCSGWCGGSLTSYTSMEKKNPALSGALASSWAGNNTYTKNGKDSAGAYWKATPKSQNSVNLKTIGYYCPPYPESYVEGGYYPYSGQVCHYLSAGFSGTRYGDIYRGTVASSTVIIGHLLSGSDSTHFDGVPFPSPVQGEDYFVAIFEVHNGDGAFITAFRNYFETGSNPPPYLDYGVLRFKYQ